MHAGLRDNTAESEPFIVSQHEDDIELGDTEPGIPNDAGAESGDSSLLDKFDTSPGKKVDARGVSGSGSGNQYGFRIFGHRIWLPSFLSPGENPQRRRRHSHRGNRKNIDLRSSRRSRISSSVCRWLTYFLMSIGALQCFALVLGLVAALFPNQIEILYRGSQGRDGQSHWPTDFTADILPVRCHSHNDYWREIPVISALQAGCTGVEADVWLYNDELYVGHVESSLTPNRTFKNLYVNPLVDVLNKQNPITEFQPVLRTPRNGVFDTDAEQTLILLIDFKTNGDTLWSVVQEQLDSLRSGKYLTYFNGSSLIQGPLTVVVTGNAPFHKVVANTTYRDMFFDAPLPELAKLVSQQDQEEDQISAKSTPSSSPPPSSSSSTAVYDASEEQAYLAKVAEHSKSGAAAAAASEPDSESQDTNKGQGYSGVMPSSPRIYTRYNSYYASTSLQGSIGSPFPYFTEAQRQQIKSQIEGAHMQGLQVRYWGIPGWPVSWRHYMWRELIRMGIDYLNVDDLLDATKGDWLSQGSFGRSIWGFGGW